MRGLAGLHAGPLRMDFGEVFAGSASVQVHVFETWGDTHAALFSSGPFALAGDGVQLIRGLDGTFVGCGNGTAELRIRDILWRHAFREGKKQGVSVIPGFLDESLLVFDGKRAKRE